VVARGKKRKSSEEMGFESGFIGEYCSVEERERDSRDRARLRSTGGAGVPFGCVAAARVRQPDVAERRLAAEVARAAGEAARQHVGERRAVQACSGSGSGRQRWITRAGQREKRSGTRGRR
jgi:hypothetical protein